MSYIIDYGALNSVYMGINDTVSKWQEGISSIMSQAEIIEESTNISGNSADRMKEYLKTSYSYAYSALTMLFGLFMKNFERYMDDYCQNIDSSAYTSINEEELSSKRESLQKKRNDMQQIGLDAERAARAVADLISISGLDISETDMEFDRILKSVDDLDASINDLENTHLSADFTEIDEQIARLDAYIIELYRTSKEFKVNFTMEGFASLTSVPTLYSAMQNTHKHLAEQRSEVSLAITNMEKRLEEERIEMEKRQKRAKWAKAGVKVVSSVAIATCVATGVGTLLVPVICEVGRYAFNAAADEYVTHGWNPDQWDSAYIGKEAVKGWFSGFTSALLPPGTGDTLKAGVSAGNNALWGGLDEAYEQLAATGTITDTKSIFFEAEKSGVSSFAGSMAGSAISDEIENMSIGLGLDKYSNPSDDIRHYVGEFITGGTDKVASGIGERFVSSSVEIAYEAAKNDVNGESILEGIDISEKYKGVLSMDNLATDFVGGGAKETVSSYITEHTPDPKTGMTPIDEHDLVIKKLAEMDARGDDARNYEVFGDPRTFSAQRGAAVKEAWAQEQSLVMQGRGTRDWTVSQQEELNRTGKVSGFEGSHMLDASSNPSIANNPDNIQFLTYEEHIYGAHGGNTRNPTTGWFDTSTGETKTINPRQLPHREEMSFELSQKYDYQQTEITEQLGSAFGYGRGNKSK